MAEQISFKTRTKNAAIQYAQQYYSYYVCKEYLILSDAFTDKPYYIIQAEKDNYLHLVGVSTSLSAKVFFEKCFDGSLTEDDFEISSHGQDEKSSKGSIRRKIKSLPLITGMINGSCKVEENFQKNTIFCSFASTNSFCTIGFISTPNARPKTLLLGDELDASKAKPLILALSKNRSEEKFNTILVGTDDEIKKHFDEISEFLSEELLQQIVPSQADPSNPNSTNIDDMEKPS